MYFKYLALLVKCTLVNMLSSIENIQIPSFLITIDTEGDNIWLKKMEVQTNNASYLNRFQKLCEKYDLKPTYLTNYEMAKSKHFQEFGKDVLKRSTGEIGMHLHAWNMPPSFNLTGEDYKFQPYLIEYPKKIMREKVKLMTDLLENIFNTKMLSHRAGRWAFNETYSDILIDYGYLVDCSVTPFISWKKTMGSPTGSGGSDYCSFPVKPYFINPSDISKEGNSSLLEIPVTIMTKYFKINKFRKHFNRNKYFKRVIDFISPMIWLRPDGSNLKNMLFLIKKSLSLGMNYVEFVLHSSELMPGGSPYFRTSDSIEKLYEDLEILFSEAKNYYIGQTLIDFYKRYKY